LDSVTQWRIKKFTKELPMSPPPSPTAPMSYQSDESPHTLKPHFTLSPLTPMSAATARVARVRTPPTFGDPS
jgi:hypothetical protein